MTTDLNLRFLDLEDVDFGAVTMASEATRWKALAALGIAKRDDVGPLAAWRDAMADENGIPRAELDPHQGGCLDLGFTSTGVRLFVWFLA